MRKISKVDKSNLLELAKSIRYISELKDQYPKYSEQLDQMLFYAELSMLKVARDDYKGIEDYALKIEQLAKEIRDDSKRTFGV